MDILHDRSDPMSVLLELVKVSSDHPSRHLPEYSDHLAILSSDFSDHGSNSFTDPVTFLERRIHGLRRLLWDPRRVAVANAQLYADRPAIPLLPAAWTDLLL